jgi:hypothetical protein
MLQSPSCVADVSELENFATFMEQEYLLPCLEGSAVASCSEPVQYILYLKIGLILSSLLRRCLQIVWSLQVFRLNSCFISPSFQAGPITRDILLTYFQKWNWPYEITSLSLYVSPPITFELIYGFSWKLIFICCRSRWPRFSNFNLTSSTILKCLRLRFVCWMHDVQPCTDSGLGQFDCCVIIVWRVLLLGYL